MKKKPTINRVFFTLSISLLLSSCAVITETASEPGTLPIKEPLAETVKEPSAETTKEPSADTTKEPKQPAEFTTQAFPEDVLYELLVADIALIRGQFDLAQKKYLQQAHETRDVAIIKMANRIANHQGEHDLVLETAQLWLSVAPDQPMAHHAALQAYALQGDPLKALPHAYWLYTHKDDVEALLAITSINEGNKKNLIPALIKAYQNLSLIPEKRPTIKLAEAILYRENGELDRAVECTQEFLLLAPDNQRGLLFLAQVLHQQDKTSEALRLLEDTLQRQPENRSLRLQYARFLTLIDRSQAIVQFETLRLKSPNDQQVNFLLALLYLNQGSIKPAADLFNQATKDPSMYADAHYHLGSIADRTGDAGSALRHYQQVRSGRNYLAAASRTALLMTQQQSLNNARMYLQRLRAERPSQSPSLFQIESNLLVNAEQPDQAFNVLSNGLQAHPNDTQLLYARSMVAELQDNFELAEQDLRALLAQDADNSAALNALGYTMILHTDRREEAHRLIKRAYLLNPGEPAILDSLGWVLFVLGDAQQALPYLEKAMAIVVDPEIAAHLGEVQWFLGDKQAAVETWNKGLEQAPDYPAIKDTMERLGADDFGIESTPMDIKEPSAEQLQ